MIIIIIIFLNPTDPQNRYAMYNSERGYVHDILNKGADKAKEEAEITMKTVKATIGLTQ